MSRNNFSQQYSTIDCYSADKGNNMSYVNIDSAMFDSNLLN